VSTEVAGFVVVWNEGRKGKRKPEVEVHEDRPSVKNEWNGEAFNFNRVQESEVIWPGGKMCRIIVNKFPIKKGHFLLHCLKPNPQFFESEESRKTLVEVLKIFNSLDGKWLLLFNSFGALASVNHLHWHILPIENNLHSEWDDFKAWQTFSWGILLLPAGEDSLRCFVFQLNSLQYIDEFSDAIFHLLKFLTTNDIAHNVFNIAGGEGELRIGVLPRKRRIVAEKNADILPGGFEMLGFIVVFSQNAFEGFDSSMHQQLKDISQLENIQDLEFLLKRAFLTETAQKDHHPVAAAAGFGSQPVPRKG